MASVVASSCYLYSVEKLAVIVIEVAGGKTRG